MQGDLNTKELFLAWSKQLAITSFKPSRLWGLTELQSYLLSGIKITTTLQRSKAFSQSQDLPVCLLQVSLLDTKNKSKVPCGLEGQ